jgi:Ser/Thr protein kinase RdoA (MazF antagonist)
MRPLQHLLRAPTLTAELRPQFEALGQRLHDRILGLGELTQVLCHGDAHSDNNFVTARDDGTLQAAVLRLRRNRPGLPGL